MKNQNLFIALSLLTAFSLYGCGKGDTIGGCSSSQDCPHPTLYKCDAVRNICIELNPPHCTNGAMDGDETDVDCGGSCGACSTGQKCKDNADCESNKCDKNVCVSVSCTQKSDCDGVGHSCDETTGNCNTCTDKIKNGDETDVDCGGACRKTSRCGIDHKCAIDEDCQSGLCDSSTKTCKSESCANDSDCHGDAQICISGSCVSCMDKKKNGDETDVDCGGSNCQACGVGKKCNVNKDCDSSLTCSNGTCMKDTASCSNGSKDGDETDVDCGGSCGKCAENKACKAATDCVSGLECTGGKCTKAVDYCHDGQQNNSETDVDCGGNACAKCAVDRKCTTNSDCESWNCTPAHMCAAGTCAKASAGQIIINEVFTNPQTSADMFHSASKQMKYIELRNTHNADLFLQNLKLEITDSNNGTHEVYMNGCIKAGKYLVVYPQSQGLTALDIDATVQGSTQIESALPNAAAYTIKLVESDSGALIHGAKLPDMSSKAGVSAARPASPQKDANLDVFVPHSDIQAEGNVDNPYSPGLSNDVGIPMG